MRRAFHDAASQPGGPVFVSLPMDLLEEEVTAGAPAPTTIERGATGGRLEELADLLTERPAGKLGIVAGDEVSPTAAAWPRSSRWPRRSGAPVHGASLHSTAVFPQTHPLYADTFAPSAPAIAKALSGYDKVLRHRRPRVPRVPLQPRRRRPARGGAAADLARPGLPRPLLPHPPGGAGRSRGPRSRR